MLANFKKFGVAAAVASALGAAGAAQAVTSGAPGDALLIPYVFAGANAKGVVTNTLIGVVVANPANGNIAQFADLSLPNPANPVNMVGVGTLTPANAANGAPAKGLPTGSSGALHWYFFDKDSNEVANGRIPVTGEDFVRFDWNYITDTSFPSAKNVPGYIVIADDSNGPRNGSSQFVLHGAAYQIRGNWGSEAFIPVLPLVDSPDGSTYPGDEVVHGGAFLSDVIPVTSGMLLPSFSTALVGNNQSVFSLRYFLDPALSGSTSFVLWFPETSYHQRAIQSILVFNDNEVPISATTSIPHELNLVEVDPAADPKKPSAPHTAVIRDGLVHTTSTDPNGAAIGGVVNSGFVVFNVHDLLTPGSPASPSGVVIDGDTYFDTGLSVTGEGSRAGFAFSLVGIGGGAAPDQVQTELAHERGVRP